MQYRWTLQLFSALYMLTGCSIGADQPPQSQQRWLAGDHHIHSQYSVGYDWKTNPPAPIIGGDAIHPIPQNAKMARSFGLDWIVATDHGGPGHSKINRNIAYPELLESRSAQPDVIQFYGMELNTPGADHSSIIIPFTADEAGVLEQLESGFDKNEAWPIDPARDDPAIMLRALQTMNQLHDKPLVFAHHPSRSAPAAGHYGQDDPAELRAWNDAAPDVAVGMEGSPGHQAAAFGPRQFPRGVYIPYPTLGGFDQMTARLGGFWDSMLAEGRRWWITANSDSHRHHTEGGIDFWPGEYSKTWVYAHKSHAAILEALRAGRIFVTTGDLIGALDVDVTDGHANATIGGELKLKAPGKVTVTIRAQDPAANNHHGENPAVHHIDLIVGNITGATINPATDTNPSTRVVQRFGPGDWQRSGEFLTMTATIDVTGPLYVRVRGTNTAELEPEPDKLGEDPWQDLWFYSNPVFISL
jgi:hypothetical protein